MSKARVLVVDDERFFREAIEEILVGRGFRCELCEDGESALKRVLDDEIGVAVLDIRLPGIDGLEVLKRMHEARPDVRVIMLSASTDQELVLDALRLGACDYLAKPLHDEELVLAVSRGLESFELARDASGLRERLDRLAECATALAAPDPKSEDDFFELADFFAQAAAASARVVDAGKTSLMILDEEGEQLVVRALVGRDITPAQMDTVAPGHGVAGVAFEEAEPILVADMSQEDRFAVDPAPGRYETDSFVVVPIHVADEKFGVICVADRQRDGGFTPDDLALLQVLAAQIAVLMRAVRLYRAAAVERALSADGSVEAELCEPELAEAVEVESEEIGRNAEIARQVCEALANEVEPGRVLRAALRPLESGLHAEPAALFLVDPATGELVLEASGEGALREERPRLPAGTGLTGAVLQSGHLVAASDPAADARFDSEVDTPLDGKPGPLICLPLQLRGKVVGLCRLHLPEGAPVEVGTAEMLVSVLSAAVRNVLLYRSLLESIDEVATVRREARS